VLRRPLILFTCTLSLACAQEILQLDKIEVEDHYSVIEERKENSIAKRIIQGEELTQYGDMNALEMLKRTPGVTISEGKGKKGAPGKGYTKVLIDGEEVSTTSRRGGNPLEQISPDMIDRVEVMSNGSAEYSAEAMGGIVNIVLKKPKADGKTTAKLTGGAYNEEPMGSLYVQNEGKSGEISYLINATLSDNSQADDGETRITSLGGYSTEMNENRGRYRGINLNTKILYSPTTKSKYTFDGSLGLNDSNNDSVENRYSNGSSVADRTIHTHNEGEGITIFTKLKGEHHLSGTELVEWKLKWHENDQEGDQTTLQSATKSDQKDENSFRVFGVDGSYSRVQGDHFIKAGTDIKRLTQHDDVTKLTNGTLTSIEESSLRENKGAFYIQDEITVSDTMLITPGIRYEVTQRQFETDKTIDYWAPSIHALYRLSPEDNLRASISKTVKLPRLAELSSTVDSSLVQNDLNHPDVTGNPNLKEEEALSYELRYEHFFEDKGIVSVGGFYRAIDDKIEKLTTWNGTRYVERPENSGKGKLASLEFELKKSLDTYVSGLGIFGNATFQHSSLVTDGVKRTIKGTSDYLYNIGIDHRLQTYRLTYGAAYRYVGGYDDPIDASGVAESQEGYGTLDLYATKRLDETYKVGLNLKNITSSAITTTSKRYVTGVLNETQVDQENSKFHFLVTLEGRW